MKTRIILFLITLTFLFVISSSVFAQTYYVNKNHSNASDSNPGTQTLPWETISYATEQVIAGNAVYVVGDTEENPVVYDEIISFTPGHSGTVNGWIIFQAVPRRSVVVEHINTKNCDYLKIEGFKITNDYLDWDKKIGVFVQSDNVKIIDNHIYDLRNYAAIDTLGAKHNNITVIENYIERSNGGIWANGNNWLVENNEVFRLIRATGGGTDADYARFFGNHITFRRNYFHGTLEAEIGASHTDHFQTWNIGNVGEIAHNITIENNILMDAHQGIMMRDTTCEGIPGAISTSHTDWVVRNNLFVNCWSFGLAVNYIDNIKIVNNTFYNMTQYGIGVQNCRDAVVSNNIVAKVHYPMTGGTNYQPYVEDYNLFYDYTTQIGLENLGSHDLVGINPDFVDPEMNDFRLLNSSPCIDGGGFLTTITSPSGSGTNFTVEDAGYFMDGWGIIDADVIQLEGQTQSVQITAVNYATNEIIVDSSLTWTNGQGVALAFQGSAPDMGAYEHDIAPSIIPAIQLLLFDQ